MLPLATIPFWSCSKVPYFGAPKQSSAQSPTPAAQSNPGAKTPEVAKADAASPAPKRINENAQAIVLGYHRLVDKVRRPDTEITPVDFQAQMQQLKDQGISVIPLQDLLAWQRGEKDIPVKSAVITLDDGWKSQYEVAWPILKKLGYPFTLFIYTDYVKGGPKSGGESVSWEQLAEMRDAGADIEGHTMSHRDLTAKNRTAKGQDYETTLWNELYTSKQILEGHLGIKINTLAVPYGRSNEHVREMAKKAGYESIFTVNGQKITHGTPSYALGRFVIESNKPNVFASAVRFGSGAAGGPPAIAELTTTSIAAQPPNGATVNDPRPLIKANVGTFGPVDPGTLSMRISSFGKVNAKYDPQSKTLSYQPTRNLGESMYTVIVSGGTRGTQQEARWTFKVTPNAGANAKPTNNAATSGNTSPPAASPSPAAATHPAASPS